MYSNPVGTSVFLDVQTEHIILNLHTCDTHHVLQYYKFHSESSDHKYACLFLI
jgi:uncharacterized protein YueI